LRCRITGQAANLAGHGACLANFLSGITAGRGSLGPNRKLS